MALNVLTEYPRGGGVTTSGSGPYVPDGGGGLRGLLEKLARRNVTNKLKAPRGESGAAAAPPTVRSAPKPPREPQRMNEGMEPTFVKWFQLGNGPGGYMQVPIGTPGAVASGFVPKGQGMRRPENASMQAVPGFSSGLTPADAPTRGRAGGFTGPDEEDPFPHGTGAAFENERFRAARARSDRDYEQRQALTAAIAGRG